MIRYLLQLPRFLYLWFNQFEAPGVLLLAMMLLLSLVLVAVGVLVMAVLSFIGVW